MNRLDDTLEIINDLITVNGQRIWNYQLALKAGSNTSDLELRGILEQIVDQSQRFQEALEVQFLELAHDLPKRGDPSGTIARAWRIVKALFPKSTLVPICVAFDKGERALLKAYRYAEKHTSTASSLHKLIAIQKRELAAFYHQYKSLYRERQFV